MLYTVKVFLNSPQHTFLKQAARMSSAHWTKPSSLFLPLLDFIVVLPKIIHQKSVNVCSASSPIVRSTLNRANLFVPSLDFSLPTNGAMFRWSLSSPSFPIYWAHFYLVPISPRPTHVGLTSQIICFLSTSVRSVSLLSLQISERELVTSRIERISVHIAFTSKYELQGFRK
jgi:hypothetical protein